MSTHTGPMAISPRFSMSSVPALPGVMVTLALNGFISVSAASIFGFIGGIVGAFFELRPFAGIGLDPAHDEADAGHAALDAVVAELASG